MAVYFSDLIVFKTFFDGATENLQPIAWSQEAARNAKTTAWFWESEFALIFLLVTHTIGLCFTLRSWLHMELKSCPLDWKTTTYSNVVPSIFQHSHIYQGCCKNTKSTFRCIDVLQSRGQGPKWWKTKGKICSLLSTGIRTLSPGLEVNYTLTCSICIFPTFRIYVCMLENFLNNISMFGCAAIKGTTNFLGEI